MSYARPDRFARRAKAEGYAARSVFKLQEIDRRVGLLKRGMRVLDLGCFPGSWSRYAGERIGPTGVLVGVDFEAPRGIEGAFLATSVFDVAEEDLLAALGGPPELVLSDMAPNTTGDRVGDHLRQVGLAERALQLADALGGQAFLCKVFDGPDANAFVAAVKERFPDVRRFKPEATRSRSVEFFVLGGR